MSSARVKRRHLAALYRAKRYESLWGFLEQIQPDIPNEPEVKFLIIWMVDTRMAMTNVAAYIRRLWPMVEVVDACETLFRRVAEYKHADFGIQLISHPLGRDRVTHAHIIKSRFDLAIEPTREFSLAYLATPEEHYGLP